MSYRKICSYRNCSSDTNDQNCTETFFKFPRRDKERYKLWVKLSGCEESHHKNNKSIKYLCSKHFDHYKYMSSNPRRKLLLSSAIPFPYDANADIKNEDKVETGYYTQPSQELTVRHQYKHFYNAYTVSDNDDESNDQLTMTEFESNHDQNDNDNENVSDIEFLEAEDEAWTSSSFHGGVSSDDDARKTDTAVAEDVVIEENQLLQINQEDSSNNCIAAIISNNTAIAVNPVGRSYSKEKRKIENSLTASSSSTSTSIQITHVNDYNENDAIEVKKRIMHKQTPHIQCAQTKSLLNNVLKNKSSVQETTEAEEVNLQDNDLILRHPDIVTYKFRNEEYIQMPKSIYCEEKRKLLNDVKYYKDTLLKIKKQLSNVKL